jgi:hypothetical protein
VLDCLHLTNNQPHCKHSQMAGVKYISRCYLVTLVYLALLFNCIRHTASRDRAIMSSDLARLWEDTVTASSKLLSRHLPHATMLAVYLNMLSFIQTA